MVRVDKKDITHSIQDGLCREPSRDGCRAATRTTTRDANAKASQISVVLKRLKLHQNRIDQSRFQRFIDFSSHFRQSFVGCRLHG
jgi:hypothetical protein